MCYFFHDIHHAETLIGHALLFPRLVFHHESGAGRHIEMTDEVPAIRTGQCTEFLETHTPRGYCPEHRKPLLVREGIDDGGQDGIFGQFGEVRVVSPARRGSVTPSVDQS